MTIRNFLAGPRCGAAAALGACALMLTMAYGATAEDTRPKEIPYETPGEVPLLNPEYRKSDHKVVLITDDRLSPRRVELESGQLVAWISYSRAPTTIVFEREVARSMICHSLVNFHAGSLPLQGDAPAGGGPTFRPRGDRGRNRGGGARGRGGIGGWPGFVSPESAGPALVARRFSGP
jgi:hypothetical protein